MKFAVAAIFFQIVLIILFAILARYDPRQAGPSPARVNESEGVNGGQLLKHQENVKETENEIKIYAMFQDVHVMIFVGFGFLMTFLRKYGFGSVGYNFFISALAIQWYMLVAGCIKHRGKSNFDINFSLKSLVHADFSAAAVLITFGVVLGKVSRLQLLVIAIIEIVMFAVNEFILLEELKIADAGGSLVIHCFGCYFGMALSLVLRSDVKSNPNEGSEYHSDIFAMIGTLFLWMLWPSFNSVLVSTPNDQQRTVINTYLSLGASCITTFAVSELVSREKKLSMVHLQNATLAGGVAIGTLSNMFVQPWGAALIGFMSGIISTLGYTYVTPFLAGKFRIHDTCGVNNLHGMPALLAGIAGAIAAKRADEDTYGGSMKHVFEAGRSPDDQSGFQILGILVTLGISLVSGAITGFIVKRNIFDPPRSEQMFDDEDYWESDSPQLLSSAVQAD